MGIVPEEVTVAGESADAAGDADRADGAADSSGSPDASASAPAPADAVAALFSASYLDLVRLAAVVLRDRVWAEDVVQEAFAKVQTRWPRIRDGERALAYLRVTVLNGARTELRRRRVRAAHPDPQSDEVTVPAAEAAALDRLGRSDLLAAIAVLPRRQRNIVLLRFVQDLSIAETAATLRISADAVKGSQRRAVENLQKRMENNHDD